MALVVIVALNLPGRSSGSAGPSPSSSAAGASSAATARPGAASGSASATVGPLPSVALATPIQATIPRDGRTLGSASAPALLEVWADFQCPSCGNFSRAVEPVLIENYVVPGKLRITFHDFAFLGQESLDSASAARCAGDQGKFWEYQALIFANQNGENEGWFSRERLEAFAVAAGVDRAAWATCYDGGGQRQAVTVETKLGQKAGIKSTPTLALNGKEVPLESFSGWSDLLTLIDKAIAASGSPGSPSTAP